MLTATKSNDRTTARATVATDDFEVQFVWNLYGYGREANRKTRVYVSGEVEVDFSEAYGRTKAGRFLLQVVADRGYGPIRGDDVVTDKLFDSLNREVVRNEKDVVTAAALVIPELREALAGAKLTFNRKAGCGCGCSPAFVPSKDLGLTMELEDHKGDATIHTNAKLTDIYVTRTRKEN